MIARTSVCGILAGLGLLAAGCEPTGLQSGGATTVSAEARQQQISQLEQQNQELQTDLTQAKADLSAAVQRARDAEDAARSEAGKGNQAVAMADKTIRRLRNENDAHRAKIDRQAKTIGDLRTQMGSASASQSQMQSELATAKQAAQAAQADQAAEAKKRQAAEAEIQRIASLAETLRSEVIKRDRRITELELKLTGKATTKPEPPPVWPTNVPKPTVPKTVGTFEARAHLTAVSGDTARMDAGTALGVRKGMKLAVYRADKFVAYFEVAQALADNASGFLVGRKLDPRVGDTVMAIPK